MKIIQFTAENIKKLKAVNIRPDGTLVLVTGANAQGKSSGSMGIVIEDGSVVSDA